TCVASARQGEYDFHQMPRIVRAIVPAAPESGPGHVDLTCPSRGRMLRASSCSRWAEGIGNDRPSAPPWGWRGFLFSLSRRAEGAHVSPAAGLEHHGFVRGLPPQVLAELAALAGRREFTAGTVIFREGTACDELYLIDSGLVALDVHFTGRGSVRIL